MPRKAALKRLAGLAPQVEAHLAKIEQAPTSLSVPHWRKEVDNWLRHMEVLLPHVGARTAADWEVRIAEWRARLGT